MKILKITADGEAYFAEKPSCLPDRGGTFVAALQCNISVTKQGPAPQYPIRTREWQYINRIFLPRIGPVEVYEEVVTE